MICVKGFLLLIWINSVALKDSNYPLLYYFIDGRDQVAVVINNSVCYGGVEI
jgi:hypothetical protein